MICLRERKPETRITCLRERKQETRTTCLVERKPETRMTCLGERKPDDLWLTLPVDLLRIVYEYAKPSVFEIVSGTSLCEVEGTVHTKVQELRMPAGENLCQLCRTITLVI